MAQNKVNKLEQSLVGRTISKVDKSFGDNVIRLEFTDGTDIVVDTNAIGLGLYAPEFNESAKYGKS